MPWWICKSFLQQTRCSKGSPCQWWSPSQELEHLQVMQTLSIFFSIIPITTFIVFVHVLSFIDTREFQWLQIEIPVNLVKSMRHIWVFLKTETFVLISGFSTKIFVEWLESRPSVIPIYKKLIAAGLRIWVYRFVSLHCGDSNQWFNEIFFITLTLSLLDGSVVIQMEEFLYYLQDTA